MTHLPMLPVLIPLVAAILMLALHRLGVAAMRMIGLSAVVLLGVAAALLLRQADAGVIATVALGDWPAPFGILFVADRLAALMVAVNAAIAVPALLAASAGWDLRGRHFHPVFQLLVAGLNGAFLTGDLFNLFVFFEVLLIASYALLAHGGGAGRMRAALHYVVLNLAGSVLFLIALALIYGSLGTLNLADVAQRLPLTPAGDQAQVRTALVLLAVVFGLKAALVPLSFWLPHAYAAATAPVAAMFAIMTKVGIYALLRLSSVAGEAAPFVAGWLSPWLLPVALATVAIGTLGMLSATRLAGAIANLVLVSTASLAAALALGGAAVLAAALYYLPHTTVVTAALFLLAGQIESRRGAAGDRLTKGRRMGGAAWLGAVFLVLAVAVSGLPPLSGFLGKLMLMSAAPATAGGYALWGALVLSGFVAALTLARAASTLFWEPTTPADTVPARSGRRAGAALLLGVTLTLALVAAAAPLAGYARATADQVVARQPYLDAVAAVSVEAARERRP